MEKEKTQDQTISKNQESINEEKEQENTSETTAKSSEEIISDLENKIVRQYADMENQRRRYEKEKEDAYEYGGFSFAKEILNLIDNLKRSKENIENDESLKDTKGFDIIINHLDIIYNDMISILKKNNIQPIECIGKKLDPNLHQAMMEIEDENKESGIVLQEIQKGFMMKDRLLRPSLVGVSKKLGKKQGNSSENRQNNDEKK